MFTFDATQHEPQQAGAKHPPGNKFPFTITNTEVKDTKANDGQKLFEVTFTSPAGQIRFNYNLWNASETARKIAVGQLSALCHAIGIFKVTFPNDNNVGPAGNELKGGKGLMDVGFQSGHEPSAEKPEGGYVEIKKIYDVNGNEPGNKTAAQASSGFGQPHQPNPGNQQPNVQSGWGSQPNANPAPNLPPNNNAGGGWQPGNNQQQKPPWG